jgi:hypothetical protein
MAHAPKKLAYWTDHHRRWQSSGLSQRRYCQREGLSFATFDLWRRHARQQEEAASPAKQKTDRKLTLVPLQLGATAGSAGEVQIRSPGGWHITLPTTIDAGLLVQLLSQLP